MYMSYNPNENIAKNTRYGHPVSSEPQDGIIQLAISQSTGQNSCLKYDWFRWKLLTNYK